MQNSKRVGKEQFFRSVFCAAQYKATAELLYEYTELKLRPVKPFISHVCASTKSLFASRACDGEKRFQEN